MICPKIKLVEDVIAVLILCKSDEDLIKNKVAIVPFNFQFIEGYDTNIIAINAAPD